ncbi:hypothetical protein Dtox_1302 [Desulfofarcimen acetoxidans DSM 771]|uniref:DUF3786 domain-containing protein n=1 Tax=Desulfofarcimen acetoxidans (strain ATCC 49208 / DSM 771 / KCTC 5769 / VKM B-1644 / 5575) TaxID=485916 RepID=C8W695_DESAS|nr:DUF3786 domain-containing protein [Desulfofarcimen acetoxidans]ACV62184.1 hypothetical protein Dtox_1302 [Desulfofarcimen acetoxidans DSM 771]
MAGPKITAYQEALNAFLSKTPEEIILPSGAKYDQDARLYKINYCGMQYSVNQDGGIITPLDKAEKLDYNDETLILQYLTQSSGIPAREKWINFLQLPGGEMHLLPFKNDALFPLAKMFGEDAKAFFSASRKYGAEPIEVGDHAVVIQALPKIPLVVALWMADDEFPAKSNILFDETAPLHLSTASLWVLGIELAKKIMRNRES